MKYTLNTTYYDGTAVNTVNTLPLQPVDPEGNVVNIYPSVCYDTFEGFGGAVTEATAYTWSLMPQDKKAELIEACFGKTGLNYKFARISLDSCDFSVSHYQAVTDKNDTELSTFSLKRDKECIMPFLHAAEACMGEKLQILLSPWSPPDFMKDTGKRNQGGVLLDEYKELYAEYICKYIEGYKAEGFNITMLTIQNEPNATQTWDSCRYSGTDERLFLRDYLFPALVKHDLNHTVGVYIWDHNKERAYERAVETIQDDVADMIAGVAVHWYTGEHYDALRLIKERFPTKKLIFSEGCVEYRTVEADNPVLHAMMYAFDIIGNLNSGLAISFDWNLLLNAEGGPNHVGNFCAAPIMCDTDKGTFRKQLSYDYIRHLSAYIMPNAVRIATTKYIYSLAVTAFKNPDDTIVLVIMNASKREKAAAIRMDGETVSVSLPPFAIGTLVIERC